MGKESSGIFANWLRNFATIVFMQSFHAVYLMFIMKFIAVIGCNDHGIMNMGDPDFARKEGVIAIISIVALWGLIKMEKLIKSMFGIQDSKLMGGIGDNLAKSMMSVKSGMDLARRTREPFDKHREAKAEVDAKQKAYDRAVGRRTVINNAIAGEKNTSSLPVNAASQQTLTNQTNIQQGSTSDTNINTSGAVAVNGNGNGNALGNGTGNVQLTNDALNRLIMALENNSQALQRSGAGGGAGGGAANSAAARYDADLAEQDAYEELQKAKRDEQAWKRKRVTRLATTIGAGAMGLGATDNLGDAVTVSNLIDKPLDFYTDRKVDKHVNTEMAEKLAAERNETNDKLTRINESHNRVTNNGTRKLSPQAEAKYEEVKSKYEKQVQRQAAMAQKFLDDIPQDIISSAANTWVEMMDNTPMKITRKEGRRMPTPTLNTSFNRTVAKDVKNTVRRKPTARSVDEL